MEQRDFVSVVEVSDLRRTADALVGVVNLIHHTMIGWNPAPGSVAAIDLANAETGRGDTPWGPTPVETFVTVTSGTALMMTDHLHAASLTLRDDNDFGPLATARCTLEAAGRVLWLLGTGDEAVPPAPSVVDIRSRVERSLAVRLRGLRDMHRQAVELVQAYPDDDALRNLPDEHLARVEEVLRRAVELRIPVQRERGRVVGMRTGVPPESELGYSAIRWMGTVEGTNIAPVLGSLYGHWSSVVHSTYGAVRGHLVTENAPEGRARIGTTINDRLRAASFATAGALRVLDALAAYFGVEPIPERHPEGPVLTALRDAFSRSFDPPVYVDSPVPGV